MHEPSIIRQVIATLEEELSAEEQRKLKNIILHVGEISNVQPILLVNAFEAFQKAENKFPQSTLEAIQIPLEIYCDTCKENSKVEKYVFRCKKCNKPSAHVVKGEELLIHKIEYFN